VLGHWQAEAVLAAGLLAVVRVSGVPWRQLRFFSPALALVGIAAVSWLLTGQGGRSLVTVRVGPLDWALREGAVGAASTNSLRALNWVLAYAILLTTTSSRDLVVGLRQLGVPAQGAAAVGMTLRFWSTVVEDAGRVMDAQRARGVEFGTGWAPSRLRRQVLMVAVPSVFLMLKRFRTLTMALALRGFGAPGRKTRLYWPRPSGSDAVGGLAGVSLMVLLAAADRTLGG